MYFHDCTHTSRKISQWVDMYKYKICKLKIQDKTLNRALCERCNVKIQDKNI